MDLGFVSEGLAIGWRWGFREGEVCQGFPVADLID